MAELPDLVGKGSQSAQDAARAAGFLVTSHDSLGRGRNRVLDRNWKVCFQTPRPGQQATDTEVDLGAVKLTIRPSPLLVAAEHIGLQICAGSTRRSPPLPLERVERSVIRVIHSLHDQDATEHQP
ncbi:PASTA domain-containing protein [Streptomyces sp. NBC_01216]|uniref:PASTA domain-containing protein n=1 Tax=Streptomyces sp. NPDC048577 TaxID=3157209 RepID=UPI002E0FF333